MIFELIKKLTLKIRILPFLTTFTQLTARLRNFLRGWFLNLGPKEGLVEFATVSANSEVILGMVFVHIVMCVYNFPRPSLA